MGSRGAACARSGTADIPTAQTNAVAAATPAPPPLPPRFTFRCPIT
ncbi:hypothetical protein SAZ11_31540 [Streptomyces sp. FXJ1.4098]|nr:hypothetical protein [Streptomyces sp. FXJ1.4098]